MPEHHAKCPTCGGSTIFHEAHERFVAVLDVYGTAESMALLGVQKSQFHVLARTDPGFPKPARIRWPGWETNARLAATPLYDGPEFREYAANRAAQRKGAAVDH